MRCLSLIGVLSLVLVFPLHSQFRRPPCVTDKTCPSGAKPPACCEPPPCQFFAELAAAKARADFFTREIFDMERRLSGGDAGKAWQAMLDFEHSGPAPNWCNLDETIPPRLMKVDAKSCAIVTFDGQPLTREDAHLDSRSCPEYIDADFDLLELRRDYCLADRSRNIHFQDLVDQYRHEYQVRADRLQKELQEHWKACSTASPNPWARREMEKAGVDMSPGAHFDAIDLLLLTSGSR